MATPGWEIVARHALEAGAAAWQAAEFAFDSPHAPADTDARAYAAPCFVPGRSVLEAVLGLNACIRRDFTFRAGVTTTSTRIAEVLRRREGVCQDFTHLMISALRGFGVPARYVSGYIRTRPSRGRSAPGSGRSTAGWISIPPTALWCGTNMWSWVGGAISATSRRCAG